jgi:hypothetical protein
MTVRMVMYALWENFCIVVTYFSHAGAGLMLLLLPHSALSKFWYTRNMTVHYQNKQKSLDSAKSINRRLS